MLMSFGLILAVGKRVQIQAVGLFYALLGVTCVCFQVVMLGEKQKNNAHHSPSDIQIAISPPQLFFLGILVMLTEHVFPWQENSLWEYGWTHESSLCLLGTVVLAVCLKLSGLFVLGVFNAVTTTALGYLKTILVITWGVIFFADEWNVFTVIGTTLFFSSGCWYGMQ